MSGGRPGDDGPSPLVAADGARDSTAGALSALPPERLAPDSVPESVALARAVGWHDVEDDWRVLHDAAVVFGVRHEGRLVAQGALGLYGSVGTVAKMIVDPSLQRAGLGRRLLRRVFAEADARAVPTLGLVATPLGRGLYESEGFRPVGDVVVMMGAVDPAAAAPEAEPLVDLEEIGAFERALFHCDRGAMLAARGRRAAVARVVRSAEGGPLAGFGMVTTQGSHGLLGPIVATSEDAAWALAVSLAFTLRRTLRVDVPAEQSSLRRRLAALGFVEMGVRPEMARGAPRLPWQTRERFALAAQAWG